MTLPDSLAGQVSLALFAAPLLVATIWDVMRFRIPNALPLALLAGFPVAALLHGLPAADWGWHLAGFAICLALGMAGFAFRLFGGGDAKLLAAVGLWAGWEQLLPLLLATSALGGLLALSLLLLRKMLMGSHAAVGINLTVLDEGAPVPYGVAIMAGGFYAITATPLLA